MRVLGIDCGTERTGWGVIESDGRRHRVLAHGVIRAAATKPLEQRLAAIAQGLRAVLQDHQPDAAAVEEVFYSQNVKTALKLAHVRGVALLAIAEFITKTRAICMVCGNPANHTQRLVHSKDRVLLGAQGTYEARCRHCFDPTLSREDEIEKVKQEAR